MTNQLYTFVRYYRKPTPSCNWCPRYAVVYLGKDPLEYRLNDTSLKLTSTGEYDRGYKSAENIVYDYKNELVLDWDEILDLGEVELTTREFKQYEIMFKNMLKHEVAN